MCKSLIIGKFQNINWNIRWVNCTQESQTEEPAHNVRFFLYVFLMHAKNGLNNFRRAVNRGTVFFLAIQIHKPTD